MLKRFLSLTLTVFVLLSLLLLVACGDENEMCESCTDANGDHVCDECGNQIADPNLDGKIIYSIKVVDADGNPLPNMIVSVLDGEEKLAFKMTDAEGKVSCSEKNALSAKDVPYTVTVTDTKNSDVYYDKSIAVLSDGKEDITVTIYEKNSGLHSETLYPSDGAVESVSAPIYDDGGYYVELREGKNYFVFVPTRRGQYKLSVDTDVSVTMGYFGSPHFVQSNNLASADGSGEVFKENNALFFNIRIFNVGEDYYSSSRYVCRIDADKAGSAILKVQCVDPNLPMSKEELPWEEYILSSDPEKYVPDFAVSGISELTDFDITDPTLKAVYNENDGFYHLGAADGPVILVKLAVDSPYLASFKTIMETTQLAVYVYGGDDVLDKKINYHTMMQKYIDAADEALGVYPLTPALKEAFTVIGDAWGWYKGGAGSIFSILEPGTLVSENAYLFACCYYTEK